TSYFVFFCFRVNCSFYFKIGACRHGDRCSRLHNKPTFSQVCVFLFAQLLHPFCNTTVNFRASSQLDIKKNDTNTIALLNIYRNPQNSSQSADGLRCAVSDVEMQEHYDEFFEEVFTEMEEKYGEVEEMNVCDNLGDHLVGNVYVKFRREEDAEKAVIDLNNRWFNGQPIHAELSPVTDFREACCRQYEMGECTRGGFCNFMHLKPISRELRRELYGRRRKNQSQIHYFILFVQGIMAQLITDLFGYMLRMLVVPVLLAVVYCIDPGQDPVSAGLDPEIVVVVEVVVEVVVAESVIEGGQEIVKDLEDSEPCHFYLIC
ncbi:hypothetical protein JD844_032620, partial [Phrynosoma platyrhinos]